jgi:hypothetical protein
MQKRAYFSKHGIKVVKNFRDFFADAFDSRHNVVVRREGGLKGDFGRVAHRLWEVADKPAQDHQWVGLDDVSASLAPLVREFPGETGRLLRDAGRLADNDMIPLLRIVPPGGYDVPPPMVFAYSLRDSQKPIPLKDRLRSRQGRTGSLIGLFHVDNVRCDSGRVIINYTEPTTEGLPAGMSRLFWRQAAVQGRQKKIFELAEKERSFYSILGFEAWTALSDPYILAARFPTKGAKPYPVGVGDYVRFATQGNELDVEPWSHRALPCDRTRLLMVGNEPVPAVYEPRIHEIRSFAIGLL